MSHLLEFQHVSYSYHSIDGETLALSDISFTLAAGEFLAIVGPSGCGKSTMLNLICHLAEPEQGKILFQGEELSRDRSVRSAICCKKTIYLTGAALKKTVISDWRYKKS